MPCEAFAVVIQFCRAGLDIATFLNAEIILYRNNKNCQAAWVLRTVWVARSKTVDVPAPPLSVKNVHVVAGGIAAPTG
jgi:hypothetical protein